jgi:hypothetical protein
MIEQRILLEEQRMMIEQENRKSTRHLQMSQHRPQAECLAKAIQKQFPLVKLEASLLVNGCVEQCPVHNSYNVRLQSGTRIQYKAGQSSNKMLRKASASKDSNTHVSSFS